MTDKAKVWQVTVDGTSRMIEQLPLQTVDKIAKEFGVPWFQVVNLPLLDLGVGESLVQAVCAEAGLTMPDLTPRMIAGMFDLVDEED